MKKTLEQALSEMAEGIERLKMGSEPQSEKIVSMDEVNSDKILSIAQIQVDQLNKRIDDLEQYLDVIDGM